MPERSENLKPLELPVKVPIWAVASFKISRNGLRQDLGPPHFVETDSTRTSGGGQDVWAYLLPTGQRLLIILEVSTNCAEFFIDPPELFPILAALHLTSDDPRLLPHAPCAMT